MLTVVIRSVSAKNGCVNNFDVLKICDYKKNQCEEGKQHQII